MLRKCKAVKNNFFDWRKCQFKLSQKTAETATDIIDAYSAGTNNERTMH